MSDIPKKNTANPRQTMILVSIAAALAILAYLNFSLKPQVLRITETGRKLAKALSDLKTAESDIAKIGGMRKAIEAHDKKLGQYGKMLPAEEGISNLLESLSEMAGGAGVNIVSIMPIGQKRPDAAARAYNEVPIMIIAKAGYHELGHFVYSLEKSERLIKVADLHIMANASSPAKHDVELMVLTYTLAGRK